MSAAPPGFFNSGLHLPIDSIRLSVSDALTIGYWRSMNGSRRSCTRNVGKGSSERDFARLFRSPLTRFRSVGLES